MKRPKPVVGGYKENDPVGVESPNDYFSLYSTPYGVVNVGRTDTTGCDRSASAAAIIVMTPTGSDKDTIMNDKMLEMITNSAAETIELGCKIGAALNGGEVFALIGNLGTGKTHLIKGISSGLKADDSDQVSSPTFVLVNEYFGRGGLIHIYHIDAYRMESAAELEALGFDEYCRPDSVVLVEWADKVLPAVEGLDPVTVRLEHVSETQRKIVIENAPEYLSSI